MRESRTYGFVRGAHSDMRPYRDPYLPALNHYQYFARGLSYPRKSVPESHLLQ